MHATDLILEHIRGQIRRRRCCHHVIRNNVDHQKPSRDGSFSCEYAKGTDLLTYYGGAVHQIAPSNRQKCRNDCSAWLHLRPSSRGRDRRTQCAGLRSFGRRD